MPINQTVFFSAINKRLKNFNAYSLVGDRRSNYIKLTDIFPDHLENGCLRLHEIDFSEFGDTLKYLDFSQCIIENANFSGLVLERCNFQGCSIDESTRQSLHNHTCFINTLNEKGISLDETFGNTGDKKREALMFWITNKITQNPSKYLNYAYVTSNNYTGTPVMTHYGDFVHFNVREAYESGWKLHLSVDARQIKKAFNLVSPILYHYGNHYKLHKIDGSSAQLTFHSSRGRLTFGSQFTIYLYPENTDDAYKMVREINEVLTKNHINAGQIPVSDKKTTSSFLSIRNDRIRIPKVFDNLFADLSAFSPEPDYISADFVGRNYNPFNAPNPYMAMLPSQKPFSLAEHFESLSITLSTPENATGGSISLGKLGVNLKITFVAFLREYLNLETSDFPQQFSDLLKLSTEEISHLIKPCYASLASDPLFLSTLIKTIDMLDKMQPLTIFTKDNSDDAHRLIESLSVSPDEGTPELLLVIEDFKRKCQLSGPTSRFEI